MSATPLSHLLICLAEECAEVIQRVTKIQRFGIASQTNKESLEEELGDLLGVVDALAQHLIFHSIERRADKPERIDYFYSGGK